MQVRGPLQEYSLGSNMELHRPQKKGPEMAITKDGKLIKAYVTKRHAAELEELARSEGQTPTGMLRQLLVEALAARRVNRT